MTLGNTTTESMETDQSSAQRAESSTRARTRGKRRNLTEEQKRELARLYSETTMPLSEIKLHFGIAESSLYRLLQQRGIGVRGRISRREAATTPTQTPTHGPRRAGRGRAGAGRGRAQRRANVAGGIEYSVSFAGVQFVQAVDIQDAMRQAQNLGATDILQIERVG